MEKAVIKTLIYGDLFNYPMKAWEVHKWLINRQGSLREVEKCLKKLNQRSKIKIQKDYNFLAKRRGVVGQRIKKEEVSKNYLRQAKIVSFLFKMIPWVKLVGVSGSLSMENAKWEDDIDFLVITQNRRIWLTRLMLLLLLELSDKRRKRGESARRAKGKICINMLLEEDGMKMEKKDLYVAHEVLQMRVLWQREGVYSKFLEENEWVFKFLPNWVSSQNSRGPARGQSLKERGSPLSPGSHLDFRSSSPFEFFEKVAKWLQVRYMGKPDGKEKISENALFFHPEDYREKVLKEFKQKLASFS